MPPNAVNAALAVVCPVPPFAIATVPVTFAAVPVVFWLSVGKVQFVRVPEDGVPSAGVTSVGLVAKTRLPVPVTELLSVTPP